MPEENRPESNPTEMAGPPRSAETARALIRKTKRATRRRFPTEDKIRIGMEGVRGEVAVAELCRRGIGEFNPDHAPGDCGGRSNHGTTSEQSRAEVLKR
jgi:hypothetical protein